MSKKLNIIEAMKMPIGTKFEVLKEDGIKDICNVKIIEALEKKGSKKLVVDNRAYIEIVVSDFISTATFIPIQQPVSFMEIVNSDNNFRVEHKLLEENNIKFEHYVSFSKLFEVLSKKLVSEELKKVIKEGKWYIEESEADSNDIR